MTRTFPAAMAACLLVAVAAPTFAQDRYRSAEHDFRLVTVADGLENPWSMAWLPDGDMLVTERPGRLRIIRNGVLLPDPVPGVPQVETRGQAGLLDVAPHPDFASNRLLYLSYSKPDADPESRGTTAVARARLEDDRLTDLEEIFVAVTAGNGHYGSRLVFDGNGHLFITTGDRQAPPRGDLESHPAQDLTNHHGKVSRILEDGGIPPDNPFVDTPGAQPSIWTYGHRNMQGLALDPATGDLWENEHGPQGGDEVNLIEPGRNYGWPVIGFGVNYGSGQAIHGGTHRDGMEQPKHVWIPSIGIAGMMFYTGDRFPRWRGNMFVGGMAGERLVRLTVEGREITRREDVLVGIGRVRDVRQGPDGLIYLAIDSRSGGTTPILRLEPLERR